MTSLRIALAIVALAWTSVAHAGPAEEALVSYDKFFTSFRPENQDRIAALFAPDAHFYGTNSVELVTTPEGIRSYFTTALSRSRGEVKATPFGRTAHALSDDIVIVSGKWQSERTVDGKMTTAGPSRVTVVLQKRGGQWMIVQFHNSPTPKAS